MTKRQRKRRTFLTSLTSLILSVALLVGTTFSWFTGSASNTGNRIVTGTLKVQLLKHDGSGYADISDSEGDIFVTDENKGTRLNGTLWEPGKTEIVYLAVKNAGNLALNYNIVLDVKNAETNTVELEKALSYAILPNVTAENSISNWDTVKDMPNAEIGTVPVGTTTAAPNGALLAGEVDYFALAIHMDENAGNEYQNQELLIDVKVEAKQMVYESDSFSNLYDANAGVTQFGTNVITSSTPNAVATLYSAFEPVMTDGTVYSSVAGRLGHTADGTPYLLFAQEYRNSSPEVTRWVSTIKQDHWVELTFPEEKEIEKISLFFVQDDKYYYYMKDYTLSYLDSEGNWNKIVSVIANSTNKESVTHTFDAVKTTKIRLDGITEYMYIKATESEKVTTSARLSEIEVYDTTGKNLATGATIEADGITKKYYDTLAIDGWRASYANWWQPSTTEGPHWVMVDFGKAIEINEMHVEAPDNGDEGSGKFMHYMLQYNAGTPENPDWVTLKEETDNLREYASVVFNTVKTQQVRFYVVKASYEDDTEIPKINSFTVYNRTNPDDENYDKNLAEGATVTASSGNVANGYLADVAIMNFVSQQISCMTAVSLEGEILWQVGTPSSTNYTQGYDLPIQIYDIDNDGEDEVIVVYNNTIQIRSMENGEIETQFPCTTVNADAIVICNLRGTDYPQDILVKDRYFSIAAYAYEGADKSGKVSDLWYFTSDLFYAESQWVGHFPYNYDIDGDGKDEIMTGNVFLDDDGSLLYKYLSGKTELVQHADGIKVGDFDPNQEGYEIMLAHSMNGNIFINAKGEIYCYDLSMGHSQKIAVGEFIPTKPGIEAFTSIKEATALYLQSADGKRIWPSAVTYTLSGVIQIDPSSFIKAGSGQEYLLTNRLHTVLDGYNNEIVTFDSSMSKPFVKSVNVCGDDREELIRWNDSRVEIWTNTAVVPDGGKNLVADATIITDSTADGYSADYLKDGNRKDNMWMSADTTDDHYIIVDFGSVKTFDELWLYGYENEEETFYPEYFKIQYNVGTAQNPQWVDIYDVKANMKKEAAFTFEPVTAQQVRILIADPTTAVKNMDCAARICEIEIYEALSGVFGAVDGETCVVDGATVINFGEAKIIDGVSLNFAGEVYGYQLQYNSGTAEAPVWTDLANVVCNTISMNNYAFTPVSTDALRVVGVQGEGAVQSINAREWSGYVYQAVVNELIINPTKSGNTGSYKWTNY